MKRVALISTILGMILLIGIMTLFWLRGYTDELTGHLETIATLAQTDEQGAIRELQTIQEDWHHKGHLIGVFVHEEPIQKVSDYLDECVSLLQNNMPADFQVKIRQAIFTISGIYQQEVPTIENIL